MAQPFRRFDWAGIESATWGGSGAPGGATGVFCAASACWEAEPPTALPVRTPALTASLATTSPAATPPAAAPPAAAAPAPPEDAPAVPVVGPEPVAGAGGVGDPPQSEPPPLDPPSSTLLGWALGARFIGKGIGRLSAAL